MTSDQLELEKRLKRVKNNLAQATEERDNYERIYREAVERVDGYEAELTELEKAQKKEAKNASSSSRSG